jgi:hypothetical protein
MFDLFNNQQSTDDFLWIVAIFAGTGAIDAIRKANDVQLRTFYPIRFNIRGEPQPLWRPYLFIEHKDVITAKICRSTTKFIKVITMRDEFGIEYPVLVRKNSIDESLGLLLSGRFNSKTYSRRRYGKGSIVRVMEGTFIDKKVRLDMNVEPDMPGTKKVAIDINGFKGSIELWKLAL